MYISYVFFILVKKIGRLSCMYMYCTLNKMQFDSFNTCQLEMRGGEGGGGANEFNN